MLRVSVLELPARWAGREAALREVDELLAHDPPDLAVLPEMAFTGYVSPEGDFDLSRFAEPLDGPTVCAVSELCKARRVHLVAPLVLREDDRMYNAAVVLGPDGEVVTTYRKRHPWYPEQWATPGEQPPSTFDLGGLVVTLAICFDAHFLLEDAADVLARADLLVFTSAWVEEEDGRRPLLRFLARRFGVSIANANWGPGAVVVPGQGGSCVLDGQARVLASVTGGSRRADAVVRPRSHWTMLPAMARGSAEET